MNNESPNTHGYYFWNETTNRYDYYTEMEADVYFAEHNIIKQGDDLYSWDKQKHEYVKWGWSPWQC